MPAQHKVRAVRKRSRRKTPWPWIGAAGGAFIIAGVALWWVLVWPQQKAESARTDDPKMAHLLEESLQLEKEFGRIRDNRMPTSDDLRQLQRAIEYQSEWMQATGSTSPEQEQRLASLQAMYDAAWLRGTIAASAAAEKTGRAQLAEGRHEAGLAHLQLALKLQQQLNQRRSGEGRDLPRETELAQETDRLQAKPIAEELASTSAEAERLRDEQKAEAALAAFQAAHELQLRLNREFGRTEFASLANLEKLGGEIATLASLPLHSQMLDLSEKAAEAAANGEHEQAAEMFAEAVAAQQQLNRDFPRSRHASEERYETLEAARQTELSAPAIAQLKRMDSELAECFRRRNLAPVAELLIQGGRMQDALFVRLPRSRLLDSELRLKFNYLLVNRDAIVPVLNLLADQFRAVPGRGVQMLGTEVSQRLYQLVMNTNPSRQAGDSLPVESVNGMDTDEFCRRLSWIIGRKVRLPTEAEYRAALGDVPTGLTFTAQVWSQERSDNRPHVVSSAASNWAGFADLLGNVAEWLAPDTTGAAIAMVAGGSYADPEPVLAGIPLVPTPRIERARTIGFRVVTE